jgi:hypothetical protein
MIRQGHGLILIAVAILGSVLSACSGCSGGGGGGSPAPSVSGKSVYWVAPQFFTDGTPLDPSRDLQGFEIYIKQDASFGPDDLPVETVSYLDNSYSLANASPPLSNGVIYYVSLRTITVDGMKSDFPPPVSFSP